MEERFWSKVDKDGPVPAHRPDLGPCWLWAASLNHYGYGQFSLSGRPQAAHRISYEMLVSAIPAGLELDHLCRDHACVNPSHLEPVTHAENMRRGRSGAHQLAKTHCPHGHPYQGENLCVDRRGFRQCRACNQARERLRVRRRAA